MYHLYDIAGYTFDTQSKYIWMLDFSSKIALNTIILILLLFMRIYSKDLLCIPLQFLQNNKSYYRLHKFAGNPYKNIILRKKIMRNGTMHFKLFTIKIVCQRCILSCQVLCTKFISILCLFDHGIKK